MLKKVLLSGVALIPIGLARLGFNAVALRMFGEHTTGQLNLALSLGMALALPVSAAFGPSVLRFVAFERGRDRPDVAGGVLTRLLLWGLFFEVVTAGLAFVFREHLPNAQALSTGLFSAAVAVGVSYSIYLVLRNGLYAVDRVPTYTGLELGASLLFFGSLGALVLWAPASASLLAFFIGYLSFSLGALFVLRGQLRLDTLSEGPSGAEVARFAGLAAVGTTASMGLKEVATVLTPTLAGFEGTAFLATALAALTPMHFLPRTLRSLLFAESATHHGRGDPEALARQFSEISHQLALFNIPIVAIVMILAEPILTLTGTRLDPERIMVFRLLALAGLLDILASTAANALAGVGRVGINAAGSALGLLTAAMVWYFAGELGLLGVAIGYFAASIARGGIPMVVATKDLGVRFTHDWTKVSQLAVMGGAAVALEHLLGGFIATGLYLTLVAPLLYPSLRSLVLRVQARRARP